MKTQLSVTVKNEFILSRLWSFLWFINLFKKMSVTMVIDDRDVHTLKASSTPYEFDLEPGTHTVKFSDPRADGKKAYSAFVSIFFGLIFSLASGGSADFGDGGDTRSDSILEFTLREGDVLRISCKPTHKGGVKVKQLK